VCKNSHKTDFVDGFIKLVFYPQNRKWGQSYLPFDTGEFYGADTKTGHGHAYYT
jgi:hypothetical protein